MEKVQHKLVAPWKNTFVGWSHVRLCVYYVLFEWTHTRCASVTAWYACVWLCFLVWVSDFVYNWVSVVAVENTNLASTSKAVCHVGAALLGAQLAHWTSQHFSLFTVAHAKPPLHLKSLQHVVNSLPKGNLHVFFSSRGIQLVRNTEEENCHCVAIGGTFFWFWYTVCLWGALQKIDRLAVVFTSCPLTVCVCSKSSRCKREKNRSSDSELKIRC